MLLLFNYLAICVSQAVAFAPSALAVALGFFIASFWAMVKRCRPDVDVVDGVRFISFEKKMSFWCVSGGFHKNPGEWLPVETMEVQVSGEPEGRPTTFFHIAKTQP